MNSLATPPVPPHFHEHTRLSPNRSSEFLPALVMLLTLTAMF